MVKSSYLDFINEIIKKNIVINWNLEIAYTAYQMNQDG